MIVDFKNMIDFFKDCWRIFVSSVVWVMDVADLWLWKPCRSHVQFVIGLESLISICDQICVEEKNTEAIPKFYQKYKRWAWQAKWVLWKWRELRFEGRLVPFEALALEIFIREWNLSKLWRKATSNQEEKLKKSFNWVSNNLRSSLTLLYLWTSFPI